MLFLADKEYCLVVKSCGRMSSMNKQGKMDSKCCLLYIHFTAEYLQEYAWHIHDVHYKAFPFSEIAFGKNIIARFPEEVKVFPKEIDRVSNNQE